jgi:uncharacterized membrane protein (DUF2068 family)
MLKIGRWMMAAICAVPGGMGAFDLVSDARAIPWKVNFAIAAVSLLHLVAAYGLLRWRRWGYWMAIPALGVFYLGAWATIFEDLEYLNGSCWLAGGL